MRRVVVSGVLVVLLQMVMPAPAFALWGWLDNLSGAGPFKGFEFDYKLMCFGNGPTERGIGIDSGCPVTGSGSSAKRPSASISLGLRLFESDRDPQYANNEKIRLVTVVPTFSWSVFSSLANSKADFVDVSVGVGAYWFSSAGFEGLQGTIVEPVKFDFHVPPGWTGEQRSVKRLLEVVSLRLGLVVFPRGFDPNAFNAASPKAVRIPAEWLFQKSIFLNIEPLLRP